MAKKDKNKPEETTETNNNALKELIPVIKEFLKDTNVNEVTKTYFNGKKNEVEAKKLANKNDLKFWQFKFSKDTIVLFVILCAIVYLSLNDRIDNCTLGTLLGSIIGFSIGNFKSNSSNH